MVWAGPDPLAYGWLVKALARHYRRRGLDLEDLVQEGYLGLLRACAGYDGRGEMAFAAYAATAIRRQIRDATIARRYPVRVPARLQRLRRRVLRGQVDPAADLTPARRARLEAAAPFLEPYDWQEPGPGVRDEPTLAELAFAPEAHRADPWELDRLRAALAELPARERRVIGLRHGLDGRPPLLLREAGAVLDYTKQRMHQLERQALRRLRLALDPAAPDGPG